MKRYISMSVLFAVALLIPVQAIYAQECLIGEVRMFAGNFAPRNWALANGQLLPISSNTALFSVLGTTYGGDGRTTFALPDLRGRVVVGTGMGPGLTDRRLGEKGGVQSVTLTTNQIPAHTHGVTVEAKLKASSQDVDAQTAEGNVLATSEVYSSQSPDVEMGANAVTATVTESSVGNNQPHENMPPFTTINFIICLTGIYPSRS